MNTQPERTLSTYVREAVRHELHEQHHSANWLAGALGVSDMWISRRLRGTQGLDLDDVDRIAAALDLPVGRLLPRNVKTG